MVRYIPKSSALLPKDSIGYKDWRKSLKKRPPPWNKGLNKSNNAGVKKISDTFKNKKIDNFHKWRIDMRKKGLMPTPVVPFAKNRDLAFLIGLVLGDGNITKYPRTELFTITLGTDKPLLWKYSLKIVKKIFNKEPVARFRKGSNCVDIRLYQQNISTRLFVPVGKKTKLKIHIPDWITNNSIFQKELIRGLYEAEASYSVHKKTYTYNFSFSNMNVSLLDYVEKYLSNEGYHPERRSYSVRLRRKKEAEKFRDFISFRKYNLI